jgi:photosystem II stability/assembly factor-like uncharacterized protein
MRTSPRRIVLVAVLVPLLAFVLVSITLISSVSISKAIAAAGDGGAPLELGQTIAVRATPTTTTSIYLPLLTGGGLPVLESLQFFTTNEIGEEQLAFLPGEPLIFHSEGKNNLIDPIQVDMQITQTGPVNANLIYSDSLTFYPGAWDHDVLSTTLAYTGTFTTTTQLRYLHYQPLTTTMTTRHVVNLPSRIVISEKQGFDKCYIPTVEQMDTWWQESPYSVFNLYMGGISFFCDDQPLDALWVHEVAKQGWTFIPTWVGPQAPCSSFKHRMSANPELAYEQGLGEAIAASTAAKQLGLLGDKIIYYDLEGYSVPDDDTECRSTVQEFLRGWNEQLQEMNHKAGVYGSPCRSYIADWAEIEPPPDDVWIAHWYTYPDYDYDPEATVWGELCGLTDEMWSNHQRIKQYTGGHSEKWGNVSLTIDSNILDGEITIVPLISTTVTPTTNAETVISSQYGAPISEMGLLHPGEGWVQVEGRLLLTSNNGLTWRDATPINFYILTANFRTSFDGWAIGRVTPGGKLVTAHSRDGGQSWQIQPLPSALSTNHPPATAAFMQFVGENTLFVSLKLQSSSNFSLGRLLVSEDNGRTWEERQLPIGEPVFLLDAKRGWTAGGPAGDQLYHTQDGGYTWQIQNLDLPSDKRVTIGLPLFSDRLNGKLHVAMRDSSGSQLVEYRTEDGGDSWYLDTQESRFGEPNMDDPSPELATSTDYHPPANHVSLPANVNAVDFLDDVHGWVVTQAGSCQGNKGAQGGDSGSSTTLHCQQIWKLLSTEDSGLSWKEISIPSED